MTEGPATGALPPELAAVAEGTMLDVAQAFGRIGSVTLYLQALRRGALALQSWPVEFMEAVDRGNPARARHLAHDLKSLCAMLGDYPLAASAAELEKPLLAGTADAQACTELAVRAAALARQLIRALDAA